MQWSRTAASLDCEPMGCNISGTVETLYFEILKSSVWIACLIG